MSEPSRTTALSPLQRRREHTAAVLSLVFLLIPILGFLAADLGLISALLAGKGGFFPTIRRLVIVNVYVLPPILFLISLVVILTMPKRAAMRSLRLSFSLATLTLFASVVIFVLGIYATRVEPYRLKVREAAIESRKITRPLCIVHVSDIQSAEVSTYEERVIETIRSLNPDLLLSTGDLIQVRSEAAATRELRRIGDLLETIEAPLGKFHVGGDTDSWLRPLFETCPGGLVYLDRESFRVTYGNTRISLLGLTRDESAGRNAVAKRIEDWVASTPVNDFRIILGHRPDYMLGMSDSDTDLCLAGHTHGGQVRIPFYGPVTVMSRVPREWGRGFHRTGNTWLNVSAGVGVEHAAGVQPLRFNCPPEITAIYLFPEHSPDYSSRIVRRDWASSSILNGFCTNVAAPARNSFSADASRS